MEDDIKSSFNEASFKMKRLHELQDFCNRMRLIPYTTNDKYSKKCFKLHYDCLISLYQEISSKLTKDEKKDIRPKLKQLKNNVDILSTKWFNKHPWSDEEFLSGKEGLKLKNCVEEGLFDCEEKLRDYLDIHGFSTMNQENIEGDTYN